MIKPLKAEHLRPKCIADSLSFKTTDELQDLPGILGQERALQAMEFSIGVRHRGFNLYVMGPSGLAKHGIIRKYLARKAADEQTPHDWCFVRNFEQDYKPQAIKLPSGKGKAFKKDMNNLIEDLGKAINAAFETTEYQNQIQNIEKEFTRKQNNLVEKHVETARNQNIQLSQTPSGFMLTPMKEGKTLSEEEFEALTEDERQRFDEMVTSLQDQLEYLVPEISRQRREYNIKVKKLNR
ncbi:MAG TPA: Lon-like protease helical domain-containing protein, partial [Gammaproteobacteria bacterium]